MYDRARNLDEIAESPYNGNIGGIRWYLQVENSNLLDGWSRGCSVYTTDQKSGGLVKSGIDTNIEGKPVMEYEKVSLLF